jgi:aconitate hydratase
MIPSGQDSLKTRSTLEAGGKRYSYYSLSKAAQALRYISRLPFSMNVLL